MGGYITMLSLGMPYGKNTVLNVGRGADDFCMTLRCDLIDQHPYIEKKGEWRNMTCVQTQTLKKIC